MTTASGRCHDRLFRPPTFRVSMTTQHDGLVINGGQALAGSVDVCGFKHSLVTVIAAAAAAHAPLTLHNIPPIAETEALLGFLERGGGSVVRGQASVRVDASAFVPAPDSTGLLDTVHGGVYLMPALLLKTGEARLPTGGGCRIGYGRGGVRPVEQYIDVLKRFGAKEVQLTDGMLAVRADRLQGCDIDLLDYCSNRGLRSGSLYSGASKMALLAAATAVGTSTLHNPYPKPDFLDLVEVLRLLGADIVSAPDGSLTVHGSQRLDPLSIPADFTLPADLIEVVTWICAGALLADTSVAVRGVEMDRALRGLAPELEVLAAMGVDLEAGPDGLRVHRAEQLKPVHLVVGSHGVYSDSQPFFALLAGSADGRSVLVDTVWKQRFQYADGLRRLGMRVTPSEGRLVVDGACRPHRAGERVHAVDLRAAAVLTLAAAMVPGRTTVTGTHHLRRGYSNLPGLLSALGADVSQIAEGPKT
ncbi:hypothetical protein ACFRQM_31985 [Streptomyces sp. NPDC056831]|uniref:hypothetical protein n=1 Tax=Streptomyces sp. NPDC056831 TaxID=3345954 RepID=UPI0036AF2538